MASIFPDDELLPGDEVISGDAVSFANSARSQIGFPEDELLPDDEIVGAGQIKPEKTRSFIDEYNPWRLWTEESMPAKLYSAYQKGVFDRPVKELVRDAADEVKDFSVSQLVDAAKRDPGKFAGEFFKGVIADPYLLLAPVGLGGRLAKTLGVAGGIGKTAGRVVEAGAVGGAMATPIEVAKQLDEQGFVNPSQLVEDLKLPVALSAILGGAFHLGSEISKTKASDIYNTFKFATAGGDDPIRALEASLKANGVSSKKARDIAKAAGDDWRMEQANEMAALEAATKPGEKTGKPVTKAEISRRAKSEAEIAALREGEDVVAGERIAQEEAARVADIEPPIAAKIGRGLGEGVELGAGSAAFKPGFQRMAEDIIALRKAEVTRGEPSAIEIPEGVRARTPEQQAALEELRRMTPIQRARKITEEHKTPDVMTPSQFMRHFGPEDTALPGPRRAGAKQAGEIDPNLLKWMGVMAGGAATGAYLSDDRKAGSVLGAALALGGMVGAKAGMRIVRSANENLASVLAKPFAKRPEGYNIDGPRRTFEETVGRTAIDSNRIAYAIRKLVPDKPRREAITFAVEDGDMGRLAPDEQRAANVWQMYADQQGRMGQEAGVLGDLLQSGNYATHFWEGPTAEITRAFNEMATRSKFAHTRAIPTYRVGIDLGLKPKTLDIADIADVYGRSLGRTVANKNLVEELKTFKFPGDEPAIIRGDEAPSDYVGINHPSLAGMRVHPELQPILDTLFYLDNPNAIALTMQAVSSVAKRGIFSYSMFHAKSLFDGLLGATRLGRVGPKAWKKIPGAYDAWRRMGGDDNMANMAVAHGVELNPRSGFDTQSELFQRVLDKGTDLAKKYFPPAQYPVRAARWVDERLNRLLWDVIHPTFKIATFAAEYERGLLQSAKLAQAGKPFRSPDRVGRDVASYVNDIYGGLNWTEMAEGVRNRYLNKLALGLARKDGQRLAQILLLAPDWTAATFRSVAKAVPGVTDKNIGALHRNYVLNSALLYLAMGDALNYAMSGHHLWDNKDPTYVDMGDGRKMQMNKHFMETIHWFVNPGQTALNKLGYIPKEVLTQATGKEYITTAHGGGPPMEGSRLGHAVRGMLPITGTTIAEQSPGSAAAGFVGMPIYGRTERQKREAKRQREREKRLKQLEGR